MTSLILVLLVIESTDVLFAIDSVPAIFGITRDPFIVFTSNIFAVMGLRALYFLLAGVMTLFRYLNYGLSAVLGFIGVKMIVKQAFGWEPGHVASLLVIIGLLGASIVASLIAARRESLAGAKQPRPRSSCPCVNSDIDCKKIHFLQRTFGIDLPKVLRTGGRK